MKLPESTRKWAELFGNGDRTAGVEKILENSPFLFRVKAYLEQRANDGDVLAEGLLVDLEDLEIERVYEEAIAEGVIQCPSGSWIV